MTLHLYIQYPKEDPHDCGIGSFNLAQDGIAFFVADTNTRVYRLARARVEKVGADGFILSGFEDGGRDRRNRQRYYYKEWWLAVPEKEEKPT